MLIESLYRRNEKQREGIHVSDLSMCIRKAYYQKKLNKRPTLRTLSFYLDGERRDIVLKGLYPERPVSKQINGIWMNPDGYDSNGDPIEAKATRSSKTNHLNSHWIRQASYYMALEEKTHGNIVVQRISFGAEAPFEWHDVNFAPLELEQIRAEIENKRAILQLALDTEAPWILDSVREDPELRWLCDECPYKEECWQLPKKAVTENVSKQPVVELSY